MDTAQAKTPKPPQLETSDVLEATKSSCKLHQYIQERITVRIDQLLPSPYRVRDSHHDHIEELYSSFVSHGQHQGLGIVNVSRFPSVLEYVRPKLTTGQFEECSRDLANKCLRFRPETQESVSMRCLPALFILDGRHRVGARLRSLLSTSELNIQTQNPTIFEAVLWSRKDGKELTPVEALSIGSKLNRMANVTMKPSFVDNLTVSQSFLNVLRIHSSTVRYTVSELGRRMLSTSLLSVKGNSMKDIRAHYVRYAKLALFIERQPDTLEKVRELNREEHVVGVTHLCTTRLLALREQYEINIILEAIRQYLKTPRSRVLPPRGRFEAPRDNLFVRYVSRLIEVAVTALKARGMMPRTFADTSLALSVPMEQDENGVESTIRQRLLEYAAVFRFPQDMSEAVYNVIEDNMVSIFQKRVEISLQNPGRPKSLPKAEKSVPNTWIGIRALCLKQKTDSSTTPRDVRRRGPKRILSDDEYSDAQSSDGKEDNAAPTLPDDLLSHDSRQLRPRHLQSTGRGDSSVGCVDKILSSSSDEEKRGAKKKKKNNNKKKRKNKKTKIQDEMSQRLTKNASSSDRPAALVDKMSDVVRIDRGQEKEPKQAPQQDRNDDIVKEKEFQGDNSRERSQQAAPHVDDSEPRNKREEAQCSSRSSLMVSTSHSNEQSTSPACKTPAKNVSHTTQETPKVPPTTNIDIRTAQKSSPIPRNVGELSKVTSAAESLPPTPPPHTPVTRANASCNKVHNKSEDSSEARSFFDDRVPDVSPAWALPPPPIQDDSHFTHYAELPPSFWHKKNHVLNRGEWARALCLPGNHRASLFISNDQFMGIHHMVFWHAALTFINTTGFLENPLIATNYPTREVPPHRFPSRPGASSAENKGTTPLAINSSILLARDMDILGLSYFAAKQQELKDTGVCVLRGFLDDRRIGVTSGCSVPEIEGVLAHAYSRFRNEQHYLSDIHEGNPPWHPIINRNNSSDSRDQLNGHARFMSSTDMLMGDLENGPPAQQELARVKARTEARIGQIAVLLALNQHSGHRFPLKTPESGMRLLLTGRKCPRQAPHVDYSQEFYENMDTPFTPLPCTGYSFLFTGADEAGLAVYRDSHKHIRCAPERAKALAKLIPPDIVRIPPYSILVIRGDTFHAGLGDDDDTIEQKNRRSRQHSVRGHMYMTTWDEIGRFPVPNAVFVLKNFKPPLHPRPRS